MMRTVRSPGRRSGWPARWAAVLMLAIVPGTAAAGGVVVVRSSELPTYVATTEAFRKAYGRSVSELSLEELPASLLLDRVRSAHPEVVVAVGLRAAVLIRDRLPRQNLVYAMVPSPERHDLAGSRITGIAADIPPALELGVLRDLVPDLKRVSVLVGEDSDAWSKRARDAGERMGLEVKLFRIEARDPLGPRVRQIVQEAEAVWMPADADVATPETFRFLVNETLAHRRPLLAFAPGLVRGGALAAAAPDLGWVGERLADAVRRIQAGERAGDIPALPVLRVRVVANLATARAIGRALPTPALTDAELVR